MEKMLRRSFDQVNVVLCVNAAIGSAMDFLEPYIKACRQGAAFYEVKMRHIWDVSKYEPYRGSSRSSCILPGNILSGEYQCKYQV